MKNLILFIGLSLFTFSCTERENQQEIEKQALTQMFLNIDKISLSVKCTNAEDWKFTAIGSKPCGGPTSYVPYHKNIDETMFLKLVEDYTKAQKAYNEKWGGFSDCSVINPPKGVSCVDGKAVFTL